ncbi:MAG: DUF4992 family lipoprotein [Bacteroides sp.]|nr:DUF4992 family lipoprotein [Bacteroides sp.]
MNYRIKWLSGLCCSTMMLALVTSCAEGVDDSERFSPGAGVTNTQLEAPELSLDNFKVQTAGDGSQSVDVSWPVVFGASGYLANVNIVNDPENPIAIVKDSVIDGCHFSFKREIDTKYEVSVGSIGNEKLNNKSSVSPSVVAYSTMLPATTIPEGMEISKFIAENLPENSTDEIAFELIAGATYNLTGNADLRVANVTIRGDRYNRPLVVVKDQGAFTNQNGLVLRYIDFDMTEAPLTSLIIINGDADARFSTESLGLKAMSSSVKDGYIVMNPVTLESCNLRNVPSSLIATGKVSGNSGWAFKNIRIDNCVVQFKKANAKPAISLEDNGGFAGIERMTLTKSTFYNLENYKCRFLRYGVRMQPEKAFGPGATTEHSITYCTFYKTFTGDQFANNMDNSGLVATINHCIFYDIMRVDQYCFRNGTSQVSSDNVSWGAGDEANLSSNIKKMSEIVDPNFVGPTAEMFNLDEEKGGVNFRPQASICVENKIGDPRWFE